MSILPTDINKDGYPNLILAGNFYHNDALQGQSDASYGHLLLNDKKGNFTYIPNNKTGLKMHGDVRSAVALKNVNGIVYTTNGVV
jgi:enediyne biosynthesis protein E4